MAEIRIPIVKSAEDVAADARAVAETKAKAECRRRIEAECDLPTQMNLAAMRADDLLSAEDVGIYRSGMMWIAQMQAAWPQLLDAGKDIYDDANWPKLPAGVADLVKRF